MSDELWTFAKSIAQSDGRKDDWTYVMDVYKSIGGKEMCLMIYNNGARYEVLGETDDGKVLVATPTGEKMAIEKSVYTKSRKKFFRREGGARA